MGCKSKTLIKNSLSKKILCFYVILLMFISIFSTYSISNAPTIEFKIPPTPADVNEITNETYVNISVYVNDTGGGYNSSFIDWNRSLVGYWNFEHTNITQVTDNSTYGNNAMCVGRNGTNNLTTGKYGIGFYFNGSSDQYLDCGDDSSLDISSNNITIEFWIKEFESTFNKKYGNNTGSNHLFDDYGYSILQTLDGGYVVTGQVDNNNNGTTGNISLIKLDSNGSLIWQKFYGGDTEEYVNAVQQTSDGGYIIVGAKNSTATGPHDLYLIKTDSNGNLGWERTYGGDQDDEGNSVQQTSDEGYIITGYTKSFGVGNEQGGPISQNLWLLKTDASGNVVYGVNDTTTFNRTFGNFSDDCGYSVKQTNDSGYIVAGQTQSFGNGTSSTSDLWLIKTNSTGSENGTDTYTGNWTWGTKGYADFGRDVKQLRNNTGYIVTGYTKPDADNAYNVYLIKLNWSCSNNSDGEVFNKTYSFGDTTKADKGFSVDETTDDGFVISGSWDETEDSGGLLLMKTDASGTLLWSRSYGEQNTNEERGKCVKETSDGGFIIAGVDEWGSDCNSRDIWVIKTDANGNVTGSNNNQSLNKTLLGKGRDAYQIELNNGTIYGYINNESRVSTNISLYNLSQYWQHAALTYDSSEIKLYVNGTLKNSTAYSGSINITTNNLTIGKNFSGIIDEVRIWNRALNNDEINAAYNCSGTYYRNFTGLSEENYTYYVYSIDSNGNENQTINRSVWVDATAPTILNPIPSDGSEPTETTLTISANFSDGTGTGIDSSTATLWIDGANYTGGSTISSNGISNTTSLGLGVHTVNVNVSDNILNTGHLSWSFEITSGGGGASPPPPTVNADAGGPYTGLVGELIEFNGSGSTGTISSYSWNFGDGKSGSGIKPSHSYTQNGTYTVTLTVTGSSGASDIETTTATITNAPLDNYAPTISNITHSPTKVTSEDYVTIYATVIDDYNNVSSVILYYSTNETQSVSMQHIDGNIYSAILNPFSPGTVTCWINATDNVGETNKSDYQFTVNIPPIKKEIGNVTEGEQKEVIIDGSDINSMQISFLNNLTNVNTTIENLTLDDVPLRVRYDGEGMLYKYFNITVTANDTYVKESDIQSAKINFTIDKNWFEENNVSNSSITLWRYYNNTWNNLTTIHLEIENETYEFYEAESPGFSTFAVVGSKVVESSQKYPEPEIPWIIIIGFIIAAIIILIFILFKAKLIYIEKNPEE